MKYLKNRTITYIHVVSMFLMLLFVTLFIVGFIYQEHRDFDKEAQVIRENYIKKEQEIITFDTNRVLRFIEHKYNEKKAFGNGSIENEEAFKKEILSSIEYFYGRKDGTGYIFIYNDKGVKLSDPIQPHNIGENLYDFKDSNGVQVIKELIDISKMPKGGFVNYTWMNPLTAKEGSKFSYAIFFKPWNWMIGTGVYLDEIEKLIATEKEQLKKRLIKYLMEILSLAVILFGVGWINVIIVNRIITKEIDTFSNFFNKTSRNYSSMNVDEIHLQEFKKMVNYVNRMVKEIHSRKNQLEEMNQLLEKKVEEKTEHLNARNKLLAQEKNFNESLVKAQDSFIKHAIHEINTPLAVILTHLDIYKMKFGENPYLSKIEAGTKMIANIFDDLSYMVKKNRFVYEKEEIDFSLYLESRIYFFEEIALGNQQTITYDIAPDIIIYFNEVELQRIIDNNLSNAIKYAKKNSDIMVKLKENSENIVLKFTTVSSKIEDVKRIFEPFHQEEHLKGGFGLGLEIVGSICKKEQVNIDVKSTDKLTIFRYFFKKEQ